MKFFSRNCKAEIEAAVPVASSQRAAGSEDGFSLIETSIAMVIILVALLAVAQSFTYVILYNSGNKSRTQSLAVLQQETEALRSKKFSPNGADAALAGGTQAVRYVTTENGQSFRVTTVVDDDPFTDGVQVVSSTTLKEITVTVQPGTGSPGWQTAIPATVVMRRTRGN